jgi:hypothetical protein
MSQKWVGSDCKVSEDELSQYRSAEGHDHQFQKLFVYDGERTAILEEIEKNARAAAATDKVMLGQTHLLVRRFAEIIGEGKINRQEERPESLTPKDNDAYDEVLRTKLKRSHKSGPLLAVIGISLLEIGFIVLSWLFSSGAGIVLLFGAVLAVGAILLGLGVGNLRFASSQKRDDIHAYAKALPGWASWLLVVFGSVLVVLMSWLRADGLTDVMQLLFGIAFGLAIASVESWHTWNVLEYRSHFLVYFKGEKYHALLGHKRDQEEANLLIREFPAVFERRGERPKNAPNSTYVAAFMKGIEDEALALERAEATRRSTV